MVTASGRIAIHPGVSRWWLGGSARMLQCPTTVVTNTYISDMGFLTRRLVPRGVRRAAHPVRSVKRAVTPKVVKRARRSLSPVDNAVYSVERKLNTKPRRRAASFTHLLGQAPDVRSAREVRQGLIALQEDLGVSPHSDGVAARWSGALRGWRRELMPRSRPPTPSAVSPRCRVSAMEVSDVW